MQCLEKVPSKMNGLIKFNGGFGNNSWMSVQCRHSTNIGMWQWKVIQTKKGFRSQKCL